MATTSYKCLGCGAGIHYNPKLKKFKCDFCLSEYTEEELNSDDVNKAEEVEKVKESNEHLASYECKSCGAKVVTDDTTTATFCYYCHNPVIISNRFVGDFEPKKIIPFTIDKKKATETFLEWAKKKKYVPNDFYSDSQLEKITGVYLPYWWADCKVNIDYVAEGRNIRVWRVGDMEYTETKKYEIVRKGIVDIKNIGEVAFTKIDNNLLNGVQPYNDGDAIDFSMVYLSGFFAEQYDVDKDKIKPKLENRLDGYSSSFINESISGFTMVNPTKNNSTINYNEWNYTLLPTWILTYKYNGKTYVFAVNGQTGKSFGELPFCKSKGIKSSLILGAGVFAALILGGAFIW